MDGIILLWKPKGITSHDCVNRVRRLFHTKKVGHTGTLDPAAEGLLIMCVGKATKIASLLTNQSKAYEAEVSLGKATTTEDFEGEVVTQKEVHTSLSIKDCNRAIFQYKGKIKQVPPMFSAVKINGKKLYEYAREGVEVERPDREVEIYSINMLSQQLNWYNQHDVRFTIDVSCSSGTYIRTLCVDIGKALNYPAHMTRLIRHKVSLFELKDAYTFDELEAMDQTELAHTIIPIKDALDLPEWIVDQETERRVKFGQVFQQPDHIPFNNQVKVISQSDELIAIYQKHPTKTGIIKPFKVF